MNEVTYEILPLVDYPQEYTWASPEHADYYTVYERQEDDTRLAQIDVPTVQAAWDFLRSRYPQPDTALLWIGRGFIEIRKPDWAR